MIAQQILASLLASATATRRSGFLARNAAIQAARAPLRLPATRSAEAHPTTSIFRRYRSPCLVMAPSFSLPPVEFYRGVKPSHAAKPRREVASRLEHAGVGNAGGDRRGDQRADAGNEIEELARPASGAGRGDFLLRNVDRPVEPLEVKSQQLHRVFPLFRQRRIGVRQFEQLAHPPDALGAMRPNSARWPRNALTLIVRCLIKSSRVLCSIRTAC
jgi:hypothetical protein